MGNSVVFIFSYHTLSTQKIGNIIAGKINAPIIDINKNVEPVKLDDYDLVGFGAGIAAGKHYSKMIKFAEKLPSFQNKKAFIFSTSGNGGKRMVNDHKTLRRILQNKGFIIVNEFSCAGSGYFLRGIFKNIFGYNKNRPNNEDIKEAEIFAGKLLE